MTLIKPLDVLFRLAGLESSGLDDQALHYLTQLRPQYKVRVLGEELLTDDVIEYDGPAFALLETSVRLALGKPGQSFSHA